MKKEIADILLSNGAVWTVNSVQPWVEAVAIKGEKILDVGSSKELKKMIGSNTQCIDLKGALVLPGFIDSHTHFLNGGFALLSIQLRYVTNRKEFIARIAEKAKNLGQGEWILNGDWDHQKFDIPELPRKEWIDSVTPYNPVCLNRLDSHMVFVNSLALKKAGITKYTSCPSGGEILKDPVSGELTGILKDAAISLVKQHIPEASLKYKIKAAEAALQHAKEKGVTSVHDMGCAANFEVYQELLKENKLTSRIYVYIPISEIEIYSRLKLKAPFGNNFLKIGGLKGFVDGSLGSSTALFFKPYIDNAENKGLLASDMFPEGIMEKRIMEADKAGLQVAVHAIGDEANHIILDIMQKVMTGNVYKDRRWRIEHAQHLIPEDIERIAMLKIIASVQPYHLIDDGLWAEGKIGQERVRYSYTFKSLRERGAVLACGSDWTVAPLDPITGIYAAVTRQTLDGKNPRGWIPEQKISLEEAIKGYTLSGAYAEFSENIKGSLERGKLADLVVLSQNLFKIPPEEIIETEVKMTVFNGEIIYKK